MSFYVPPTIGHVDALGYTRCVACGPGDHPIIMDIAANNCAFEDVACDACGAVLPFTQSCQGWVRPHETVYLEGVKR